MLWQAAKPSGDSCTPWGGSVGMAGMPYPPNLCASVSSVGGSSLPEGSVCSVHSVGASSPLVRLVQLRQLHPLAESTEVVCKSHHLTTTTSFHHLTTTTSFHHLTISTPFHFESCHLHVLPILRVRLCHHLRLVDAQPREHDSSRRERHRHAVVVVRVDRLQRRLAARAVPDERVAVLVAQHEAQLAQLALQRLDAVGFLDAQRSQTREAERYAAQRSNKIGRASCRERV